MKHYLWGVDLGSCLIPLHVSGFEVSIFVIGLVFPSDKIYFIGSGYNFPRSYCLLILF